MQIKNLLQVKMLLSHFYLFIYLASQKYYLDAEFRHKIETLNGMKIVKIEKYRPPFPGWGEGRNEWGVKKITLDIHQVKIP